MTFQHLQEKNAERAALWTQGKTDLSFAAIELGGEVGEFLNELKKFLRFKLGVAGGKCDAEAVGDELADVVICCSLLANHLGEDLGALVARKFNKTSEKHGFEIYL